MRLANELTLTSIYAEGEEELQEASSEAELHGHSLGGTATLKALVWFWWIDETLSANLVDQVIMR